MMYVYVFFFFKQKTAYEMRISDWSSDVCSSDLVTTIPVLVDHVRDRHAFARSEIVQRGTQLFAVITAHYVKRLDTGTPRGVDDALDQGQIGRASCRERVCQYV